MVTLDLELLYIDANAAKFSDGDSEVWLPLSLILFEGEPGETVEVELPIWLAEREGLV